MRIVIDLQAAQSPNSRHRGIGRYSVSLAKAMARNRGPHEILVALNGMFAESIAPLRAEFAGLLPPEAIRVWHGTVPALPMHDATPGQRRAVELVREAFLASLQPDVVHVASLFETSAYSVTGLHEAGNGGQPLRTAITLYDLIPHIYPDVYLPTPRALAEYREKLAHLQAADLLLAISESSRREALDELGLPEAQVVTMSSAVEEHFTPAVLSPQREREMRERYGLARPFAMYTGGINHRKNIEGLIRAWAALEPALRDAHQLAVVCSIRDADRERLQKLAREHGLPEGALVLTGFVPEDDLVDFYRLCKLFVFPSQHEGFGLPALEAMRCGAPVIGADNSSIPEVIGRDDALFDAHDDAAITAKIAQCLTDDAFRASLVAHGLVQAKRFDWDSSARIALRAMEELVLRPLPHAQRRSDPPAGHAASEHPHPGPVPHAGERAVPLALVAPSVRAAAALIATLSRRYELHLVTPDGGDASLPAGVHAHRSLQWFTDHAGDYERIVYVVGNAPAHAFQVELMARHPGVVVLHDFFLGALHAHRELALGTTLAWTRELFESHGWEALVERSRASDIAALVRRYPANYSVLRDATAVIVPTKQAVTLAREWYGDGMAAALTTLPQPHAVRPAIDRLAARARLGIDPETFVVCSFGSVAPNKLTHRVLHAWRHSALAGRIDTALAFVGEAADPHYARQVREAFAGLETQVRVTGWVDDAVYADWLAAADLAVQLREGRGEGPGALLDAMAQGLPVIANRESAASELPADALGLLPLHFTDGALAAALVSLWHDPARRGALGARARLAAQAHTPEACAPLYARAIEAAVLRREHGPQALVRQVEEALRAGTGAGTDAEAHAHDQAQVAADAAANAAWREPVLRAIATNHPAPRAARRLLVDVTGWISGPRALRMLPPFLAELFRALPPGWRGEAVRQDEQGAWHEARAQLLQDVGVGPNWLAEAPLAPRPDDLWAVLPVPRTEAHVAPNVLRLPVEGDGRFAASMIAATTTEATAGPRTGTRQWFIDISELVRRDWQSGIQRVVKNYLIELMAQAPPDTRAVPVYATVDTPGYRVAHAFGLRLAGMQAGTADDRPIAANAGDVFFALDLQPHVVPAQADAIRALQRQGVRTVFMVYDLLPIRLPQCFIPGGNEPLERWLRVLSEADQAICISQATADDLRAWLTENGLRVPPRIDAVHLGADLSHSLPSTGRPDDADALLDRIRSRRSFLMVGTLEPRKGHAIVLDAFDALWARGVDVSLVISGRPGWLVEELAGRIRHHAENGRRLFWLDDASDEFLAEVYAACVALIAASLGEGFGLPLVEAAQRGLPVIARDLPVFREIAGESAFWFGDDAPEAFASRIEAWLALHAQRRHPAPEGMAWITWRESAARIAALLQAPL